MAQTLKFTPLNGSFGYYVPNTIVTAESMQEKKVDR